MFKYWAVRCNECEDRPYIPLKEYTGNTENWEAFYRSLTCKVCGKLGIYEINDIELAEFPEKIPDHLIPEYYRKSK